MAIQLLSHADQFFRRHAIDMLLKRVRILESDIRIGTIPAFEVAARRADRQRTAPGICMVKREGFNSRNRIGPAIRKPLPDFLAVDIIHPADAMRVRAQFTTPFTKRALHTFTSQLPDSGRVPTKNHKFLSTPQRRRTGKIFPESYDRFWGVSQNRAS